MNRGDAISRCDLFNKLATVQAADANEMKGKIYSIIQAMPAKDEWIPCTERTPEMSGNYLTWGEVGIIPDHTDELCTAYTVTIASYHIDLNEWFGVGRCIERVLAWMPLPERWNGDAKKKSGHDCMWE